MTTRYFRLCPASWLRRLRLMGPPRASARPTRYVAPYSCPNGRHWALMLPWSAVRRQGTEGRSGASPSCPAHEADNILHGLHGFGRDDLSPLRALREHAIDIGRVLQQSLELVAHGAELG